MNKEQKKKLKDSIYAYCQHCKCDTYQTTHGFHGHNYRCVCIECEKVTYYEDEESRDKGLGIIIIILILIALGFFLFFIIPMLGGKVN